ncbi:ABC transporter ATP-binding protein [Paenibacillus alvei TS-15]|uniref:ABC transporter ATP-binding protein n=1 Tax=Paenibacillus alvei TS-15 TaxID=1117108 RepID=S9TS74_PAEAL|nr:ABC-F family ATP-binding cassette domain-containing protein [Paenibacillus alvei]EPY05116.1 ABC transporter ATP-binding protein [Paenibacillus alvei TS-15]
MSMLSVEEVTHFYGDKRVFLDISFRLLPGEHGGIVGSNGAGKSTLLRILSGELLPDAGKVEWLPHVKVGYLQQHIDLQPGMTVLDYLRGAFGHLYAMEQNLMELAHKMAEDADNLELWLAKYGELQHRLEHSGFYEIEVKLEQIAAGLGLLDIGLDRDVEKLSGGQRTKLLLGRLLLEEPHVLLLDEPTNYLDEVHIDWLKGYLKGYKQAFLVISHDSSFLNEIATSIFHVEHQNIKRYVGNYEAFRSVYELNKLQQHEAYSRQQKEISRLEDFVQKNKIRKAKQAKSREKMLERMTRIDRPTSGSKPRFSFQVHVEPEGRIMRAEQLQIGYAKPLCSPLNLSMKRGEKIAIVGHNGVGKTTLLKTLLGELTPLHGNVRQGERVKVAYFAQELFVSDESALDQLCAFRTDMTHQQIRKLLAMTGLTEEHIRQPLSSLSGGEQAKVRLCELMLTDSNVLVLDEPTNHLDTRAKEALIEALRSYNGSVLLVSHEPDFYADWVTQVWSLK